MNDKPLSPIQINTLRKLRDGEWHDITRRSTIAVLLRNGLIIEDNSPRLRGCMITPEGRSWIDAHEERVNEVIDEVMKEIP